MSLERVAVGDHLMLGGDNMDLALARHLERRLVKRAGELDARQWGALVHACRKAKEALLSPRAEERFTDHPGGPWLQGRRRQPAHRSVPRRGNRAGARGLLPRGRASTSPRSAGGWASRSSACPTPADPAVTRNLAAFLRRHEARPDAVLFNGGAMKAALVQDRVVETIAELVRRRARGAGEPQPGSGRGPGRRDLRPGARAGKGVRIRGGTARAYYVGVDDRRPRRKRAVCLIPFGVEEGDEVEIEEPDLRAAHRSPGELPAVQLHRPPGTRPGRGGRDHRRRVHRSAAPCTRCSAPSRCGGQPDASP